MAHVNVNRNALVKVVGMTVAAVRAVPVPEAKFVRITNAFANRNSIKNARTGTSIGMTRAETKVKK